MMCRRGVLTAYSLGGTYRWCRRRACRRVDGHAFCAQHAKAIVLAASESDLLVPLPGGWVPIPRGATATPLERVEK